MRIRPAEEQDCEQIRALCLSAFPDDEGPVVADMALALLRQESLPAGLNLVAGLAGDTEAGLSAILPSARSAFSALRTLELCLRCRACILAPLAVHPSRHRQRLQLHISVRYFQ